MAGEKVIGFGQICSAATQKHWRMIGTQFTEDHVKGSSPGALMGKFVHKAAIDLARPVEAETKAERTIPDSTEAIFVDVNKAQIGCDAWRKSEGLPGANVVGNAFETLEKLKAEETKKANEKNYSQRDQTRHEFERFGFHDWC